MGSFKAGDLVHILGRYRKRLRDDPVWVIDNDFESWHPTVAIFRADNPEVMRLVFIGEIEKVDPLEALGEQASD